MGWGWPERLVPYREVGGPEGAKADEGLDGVGFRACGASGTLGPRAVRAEERVPNKMARDQILADDPRVR